MSKIYGRTLEFLLEEGFQESGFTNLDNRYERLFVLDDSDGLAHIGKSYAFLLHSEITDYRFAINRQEGWNGVGYGLLTLDAPSSPVLKMQEEFKELLEQRMISVYSGMKSLWALERMMQIKNTIAKNEAEGVYEELERQTGIYLQNLRNELMNEEKN